MKKVLLAIVLGCLLTAGVIGISGLFTQDACGKTYNCYICKGGGYVCYTGKDTFELRKQAKSKYNCEVTGTSSSCTDSNCKGKFLK